MLESPPFFAVGGDFFILWRIGDAIVHGAMPYTVYGSYYPPAASYLFVVFALLPPAASFAVWSMANAGFLVAVCRGRSALAWVLFAPVLWAMVLGQTDLFFVWLATLLGSRSWKSVAAAAVITLKPQLAVILLPWWLWRWMRSDRRRLTAFVITAAVVHGMPLLWHPELLGQWLTRIADSAGFRTQGSPNPMALYPVLGLVIAGLLAVGFSRRRTEGGARAVVVSAIPSLQVYDVSTLVGQAPAWLLVPLSWLCMGLAHVVGSYAILVCLPIAVVLWKLAVGDNRVSLWPKVVAERGTGALYACDPRSATTDVISRRFYGTFISVWPVRQAYGPLYVATGAQNLRNIDEFQIRLRGGTQG